MEVNVFSQVLVERLNRQRIYVRNHRKNLMRRAANARRTDPVKADKLSKEAQTTLMSLWRIDALIDLLKQAPGQVFAISAEDPELFGFGLTEGGAHEAIG
jgi:hypothetical protein